MILHVMPAEKFVDRAIRLFELAFPGKNKFWIVSYQQDGSDLDYVNTPESKMVSYLSYDQAWWKTKSSSFNGFTRIFLHNLYSPANIYFALHAPEELQRHIAIWGYEFYGFKDFWSAPKYGKLTQNLLDSSNTGGPNKLSTLLNKGNRAFRLITDSRYRAMYPTTETRARAYQRAHTIHTHVQEDYRNIIERMYLGERTKVPAWSHFSYYSTSDYAVELPVGTTKRILIGNSATATNNHLEVFQLLSQMEGDFEIICPLNYGDKQYADYISQRGKTYFGPRFIPLLDFLPLEEYNKLVSSCGIVIMNHYRQQGAGNIISSLLFGSKVFLSNRSPLYAHFKKLGATVFAVEDQLDSNQLNSLLDDEVAKTNYEKVSSYYSKENIIESLRKSIQFES